MLFLSLAFHCCHALSEATWYCRKNEEKFAIRLKWLGRVTYFPLFSTSLLVKTYIEPDNLSFLSVLIYVIYNFPGG